MDVGASAGMSSSAIAHERTVAGAGMGRKLE